jgi:arsenate reductase (thioredoxin)
MKRRLKIIFLCTGNSCRSQMAEGYARDYAGNRLYFYSAGISPVGVNPRAVSVMKEAGIDISGQISKAIDRDILDQADFIITLCGDARESCPLVPGKVEKRHWPLEDPARAEGTEAVPHG